MVKTKLLLFFLLFATALVGVRCVDEIELKTPEPADFLVVDGILNYSKEADSSDLVVRLTLSRNVYVRPVAVSKAKVELVVNDKTTYLLQERDAGYYYLYDNSFFKVGDSYKLRMQVGSENYESTAEIMPDSVSIQRAYAELSPGQPAKSAYEIFVDMNDVAQKKNYYRWAITQWEKQNYCLFCYRQGRNPETCSDDLYGTADTQISRNPPCDGNCFDILRFTPNNSVADVFIDGKALLRKSIGYVPYNFNRGCLIEVKQSSLTPQYYAFLEVLKTQAENTGGLADTPAALLVGNVKNLTNPSQKVVGYFSVTNNSVRRFWLDRSNGLAAGLKPLSLINPPLDPPIPTPATWFPVPCKPSRTRTPIKPSGWRD